MLLSLLFWALVVLSSVAALLAAAWLLKELTMGLCFCRRTLKGKTVLVTGGTAGVGYEAALEFARRGASVVITGRNMTKGARALETMKKLSGNDLLSLKRLDLSLQKDVRRFAAEMTDGFPRLHYLVNNAGMVLHTEKGFGEKNVQREDTEDGLELCMASNFFGQTLLVDLLLSSLKEGAKESKEPVRIVSVSSAACSEAKLDPDDLDLNMRKGDFNPMMQYSNSKLAQILYSNELGRRLEGTNIQTCTLHPGMVRTEIFRDAKGSFALFLNVLSWLTGKSAWQGAQTTIHAVVTDEDVSGKYLIDCLPGRYWRHKLMENCEAEAKFYKAVRSILGLP